MTTFEIYNIARLKFPLELENRTRSKRCFSAALQYLYKDGKINKVIEDNKGYYEIKKQDLENPAK